MQLESLRSSTAVRRNPFTYGSVFEKQIHLDQADHSALQTSLDETSNQTWQSEPCTQSCPYLSTLQCWEAWSAPPSLQSAEKYNLANRARNSPDYVDACMKGVQIIVGGITFLSSQLANGNLRKCSLISAFGVTNACVQIGVERQKGDAGLSRQK
eukprot:1161201-Pelagomonas_calceolata.AAC.3